MYRQIRAWHKFSGLVFSIFLMLLGLTGTLLALKGQFEWIRPATRSGQERDSLVGVIGLNEAADAAVGLGLATLRSHDDIDRFEYHAGKNVYKLTTKEGYDEVQVDGTSGKVLNVGKRNDQFFEDVHDLTYFSEGLRTGWLPFVGVGLTLLGLTGICMYFVPVFRRRAFKRSKGA